MSIGSAAVQEISELRGRFPDPRSAVVPALYVAQRELGWLSDAALRTVARLLDLPPATVRGTASFYSLYRHHEMGRHLVQLCTNVSCLILGAENLQEMLKERYGLEPGGTSPDGRFSLLIMECIGACDGAPAMLVDEDLHTDLNEARIAEILAGYGQG